MGSYRQGFFAEEGGPSASPAANGHIDFSWGVKIPMRDGIWLNATIYRPKDQVEPLPVVFTLTPYIGDSYHARATYFARHGYVFALIDCRGRGNSEGNFEPMVADGRDGHDIVEWLAQQPWSNGKITMWGGSYGGFDQWSTLKEFPPHLATIVPVASAFPTVDFPFSRNIYFSYNMQWLTFTSGSASNAQLFGDSSFWIEKFTQMYEKHLPYKSLDRVVGNSSTHFQTWLEHRIPDGYWASMAPTDDDFMRIDQPVLTITGHYDGDQAGAMHYYKKHMQLGSPQGRANHYLIIGPWDHAGTRTPAKEFGGLEFGDASMLDMNKLHQDWYDWTMKDGPKPEFLKKQVAYYVIGAEEWKYADSLEEITGETRRLYLDSTGSAGDAFHSGSMSTALPANPAPDAYVYDPLDLRPGELEREEIKNWATDQRYALNLFGNGLVYHSEPFLENTEITGYVKLTAWMAIDVPDTDFQASLYEILADGSSIQLTQDLLRARYRESLREAKLVTAGKVECYSFDGFTYFSRRIAKGSRLRLVIVSPNSIYIEKNYNSGGAIEDETAEDARTAHITLYHDTEHPSCLELPIAM